MQGNGEFKEETWPTLEDQKNLPWSEFQDAIESNQSKAIKTEKQGAF